MTTSVNLVDAPGSGTVTSRLSVLLIPEAEAALHHHEVEANLTRTDAACQLLQLGGFCFAEIRNGAQLLVRKGGQTYIISVSSGAARLTAAED